MVSPKKVSKSINIIVAQIERRSEYVSRADAFGSKKTGATCEADLLKAPLEGQHGSVSSCCSTFGFSVSTLWRLGKRLQDTRSQDACWGEIRF